MVSLYNGNIAAMRTAIHTPNATNPSLKSANPVQQIMAYQYDQLNRIMTTRHLDLANAYQTTAKYNENSCRGLCPHLGYVHIFYYFSK